MMQTFAPYTPEKVVSTNGGYISFLFIFAANKNN